MLNYTRLDRDDRLRVSIFGQMSVEVSVENIPDQDFQDLKTLVNRVAALHCDAGSEQQSHNGCQGYSVEIGEADSNEMHVIFSSEAMGTTPESVRQLEGKLRHHAHNISPEKAFG